MTSRKQQSKSLPSSKRRTHRSGSTKKEPQRREVALAKVKDDLSKYLRLAAGDEIVITRHGRPAGVLIGSESEDDWFDYRIENHPDFLRQIAESRSALQKGLGIRLEDLDPGAAQQNVAAAKPRANVRSSAPHGSRGLRLNVRALGRGDGYRPPSAGRDSIAFMRLIEARYEKGLLKPTEPLALRPGESVNLIVLRRADPKRWDLDRLAKSGTAEDSSLTEQGLAEWSVTLDEEDHH